MGFLTRTPMPLDDPCTVVDELATDIQLLDPHRLQIKLRKGVHVHDGKPFGPEDVKATRWAPSTRPCRSGARSSRSCAPSCPR
jgi:hypothetical protein